MKELAKLTIAKTLEGLKSKDFSSVEVASAYIKEMEKNRNLNVYISETPELALQQAKLSDEKYAKGTNGALEGIPFSAKDLFCTKGVRTTACSKILDNFVPQYESTVTQKLFNSGASILGKVNMDEFAMGGSNENSAYGPVINPWKPELKLVPGGSSGGSAAAVAANMCAASLGSDTGGSIRQPASLCGVVGIRPTYGRCSRYGVISYASSLDQAGVLAKDVRDTALMLSVISGYDEKDSTSAKIEVPNFESFLNQDVKGMKIGLPQEFRPAGLNDEVCKYWDKALDILKSRGAEIVNISLPNVKHSLAAYYTIAFTEGSSNLSRYDGIRYGVRVDGNTLDEIYTNTRTTGFGKEVKKRIMLGTFLLSERNKDVYSKAQRVRHLVKKDFEAAFEKCDVILAPTTTGHAFPIGDNSMDNLSTYLNDIFTVPVNLAGLPGMSLPIGLSSAGLPLGIQIIGKAFDEGTMFKVAHAIELDTKFVRK